MSRDRRPPTDEELGSLVRGALREPSEPDLLGDVQKRIRKESAGRFYGDGWSVEREPPTRTFLITSTLMLFVSVFIYALITFPGKPPDRVQFGPPARDTVPGSPKPSF